MVLSYLIKGTFWLTAAGLITRTAGFFYKYSSPPSLVLRKSACSSSVCRLYYVLPCRRIRRHPDGALRFIAEAEGKKDPEETRCFLRIALFSIFYLTPARLCPCALGCDCRAFPAGDQNVSGLLQLLALSLPFCAGHACLIGYLPEKSRRGSRRSLN